MELATTSNLLWNDLSGKNLAGITRASELQNDIETLLHIV